VELADCYDLPPRTYQMREVELTERQAEVYREMKEYATAKA
jgi:SNF2 family DNA or RNA helicase